MTQDENIQKRVLELTQEAAVIINEIQRIAPKGTADPLADFGTLSRAVKTGILDAPQLKNNPFGRGIITSRIDDREACIAVDPGTQNLISEKDRIIGEVNEQK